MSEPHMWVDGEKITSAKLNQLEDNIANAKADLFKTVPMVDGGATEYVKLTPRQLSEYNAAGTIVSCYHPDRGGTPFFTGVVREDYSSSSSNSYYVSTLSRGFVEITEDKIIPFQMIPMYGDRDHWIVTVTHNGDTQVLSIEDTYYGQVGGTYCEVYEEYDSELGRPTVWFYISESSSDDFSAGDFTITITQSDVTEVVAPQQTVTFEDEGSSEYYTSLETSTGYILPYYNNVYPSSRCFVEGTEVYSGSSYDQEDPFTGNNYHISSSQSGEFILSVRDDNNNPVPGRYYVVVKYVYNSDPAEGAPDPEGKYSYLPAVESKDIDYGIRVGDNYSYGADDEDQNYSYYWD